MDYVRQKRIVAVCALLLTALLALAGRIFFIQADKGAAYALKALRQRTVGVSLESVERGNILDRRQRSLLDSKSELRLIAFPNVVEDKQRVARELAGILLVEEEQILKRLEGKAGVWPESLNRVQREKIAKLKIAGLGVQAVEIRYGDRPLASNTLGYLGKIGSPRELELLQAASIAPDGSTLDVHKTYTMNDLVGKTGLESFYEQQLKGSTPLKTLEVTRDGWGNYIRGLGLQVRESEDTARNSLVLTLDRDIQQLAEEALQEKGLAGAVVVMKAGSGDLLALASNPTFRPDQVNDYLTKGADFTFLDQTACLWQPGSVFKVLVASAALEEGLAKPTTQIECNKNLVKCNIREQHSSLSLEKALELSCNPAFARLGLELGGERLAQYARLFGLADQGIIGIPDRQDTRQNWKNTAQDTVNSSIGQGPVLVTPVQVTSMMAVVANGGTYIQPRLVKEIRGPDNRVVSSFAAGKRRQAISQKTADKMATMLEGVVIRGTGNKAGLERVRVAGKTGSAQTGRGLAQNLDQGKATGTDAWFSGFFPAENPGYVVTVLVHNGVSGGETAAPIFRKIAEGIKAFPN